MGEAGVYQVVTGPVSSIQFPRWFILSASPYPAVEPRQPIHDHEGSAKCSRETFPDCVVVFRLVWVLDHIGLQPKELLKKKILGDRRETHRGMIGLLPIISQLLLVMRLLRTLVVFRCNGLAIYCSAIPDLESQRE